MLCFSGSKIWNNWKAKEVGLIISNGRVEKDEGLLEWGMDRIDRDGSSLQMNKEMDEWMNVRQEGCMNINNLMNE